MAKDKIRLDQLLVERGLAESRQRAQAVIMAGHVFGGEKKLEKPGHQVARDADIDVRGRDHPWVSRGGLKLAHALDHFHHDPTGETAIDVGSSTGGFTDVLLARGAAHVYAVDSGTNQLAWKLRQDPRVTVHEQRSARLLTSQHVPEPVDLVVCDASFISLAKVLPVPLDLMRPQGHLFALIKPQFEATRDEIGKNGVVRDNTVRERVCRDIGNWLEMSGFDILGLTTSPITGPKGNVEFLIGARKH